MHGHWTVTDVCDYACYNFRFKVMHGHRTVTDVCMWLTMQVTTLDLRSRMDTKLLLMYVTDYASCSFRQNLLLIYIWLCR